MPNVTPKRVMYHRCTALLFAAFAAAACATGTDYAPRTPGSQVGYTDVQLAPNRFRVNFSGSYLSTRDDVERYLLRRAAEITLLNGYTHFVMQMRETTQDTDPVPYGGPYYGTGYGYWGNNLYWNTYSSSAEILLLKDIDVANAANAVAAQDVLVSLKATQPPGPVKTAAGPE